MQKLNLTKLRKIIASEFDEKRNQIEVSNVGEGYYFIKTFATANFFLGALNPGAKLLNFA